MLKDTDGVADGVTDGVIGGESLRARGQRWREAMRNGDVGPLIIAKEVADVVEHWSVHRAEANGKRPSGWLREVFGRGKGAGWWRRRAKAVDAIGEAARRNVHHDVAVWVSKNVPPDQLGAVRTMLYRECRNNGGNPITLGMAVPRIRNIIGPTVPRGRSTKLCRRCQMLEALLREHGVEVPED